MAPGSLGSANSANECAPSHSRSFLGGGAQGHQSPVGKWQEGPAPPPLHNLYSPPVYFRALKEPGIRLVVIKGTVPLHLTLHVVKRRLNTEIWSHSHLPRSFDAYGSLLSGFRLPVTDPLLPSLARERRLWHSSLWHSRPSVQPHIYSEPQ